MDGIYGAEQGVGAAQERAKEIIDSAKAILHNEQSFAKPGYIVSSEQATRAELERRELQKVGAVPFDAYNRLPEVPIQTQVIRLKILLDETIRQVAHSAERAISEARSVTWRTEGELGRAKDRIEDLEAAVEVLLEGLLEKPRGRSRK